MLEENKVKVTFDQPLSSLNNDYTTGIELGYRIANTDSLVFTAAKSKIEGNAITVWNNREDQPGMIRYGWLRVEDADLFNKIGLPAHPFRMKIKK